MQEVFYVINKNSNKDNFNRFLPVPDTYNRLVSAEGFNQ